MRVEGLAGKVWVSAATAPSRYYLSAMWTARCLPLRRHMAKSSEPNCTAWAVVYPTKNSMIPWLSIFKNLLAIVLVNPFIATEQNHNH